jgi:hypothetical protein
VNKPKSDYNIASFISNVSFFFFKFDRDCQDYNSLVFLLRFYRLKHCGHYLRPPELEVYDEPIRFFNPPPEHRKHEEQQ